MNVLAVNGGPRKTFNTAMLLQQAMAGAESVGAKTEMIHLYDYQYQGCVSCFACKRKDCSNPGHCALPDALSEVLERALRCDVLLLGSPIYLGEVTGLMRCFMERLLFPVISYDKERRFQFTGSISTGLFYTMNMPEKNIAQMQWVYQGNEKTFSKWLNGTVEYLASYDTWQFDDYGKYTTKMFDLEQKAKTRAERFPLDLKAAFEIGARLSGEKA